MTEKHTPLPYLRDGSLIYALDETGTCNRISIRVEGGISVNWRRSSPERTTDEEVEATAAFVHQAVNSHHRLVEALEQIGELTKRRQLPLTNEINDIVLAALKEAGHG